MTKSRSVLVDTSFLISVYDTDRENNRVSKQYFKYFKANSINMILSTIVISEYHQKSSIIDIINSGDYQLVSFDHLDGIKTAEVAFSLGKPRNDKAQFKDDLKLLGQSLKNEVSFIITEDKKTLGKYAEKLIQAGVLSAKIIISSNGFDVSHFNGGQTALDVS